MSSTVSRIGKYELRAVLARTQMSSVYDGWDSDIARRVAIKVTPLSAIGDEDGGVDALTRFKRGAQAAGKLSHPNIVSIYDYGESGDQAYLVMEFVEGPTLKELFDQRHGFNLQEIGTIVSSMLDALQYSHDHGVVHRDIKPDNVMFTKDMRLKLTDFGIARLEDSDMTRTGMVIGTPAYMSPEQFLGEPIDRRTDVYSTGVVLFNMLTGERPYEGSLATIMHKVLYTTPAPPSRISTLATTALDDVVLRAMAKKREERFPTAAEFKAALQRALAPPDTRMKVLQPAATRKSAPAPRADRAAAPSSGNNYREVGILAAIVVVIAATGIGAAWYLRDVPTAPSPTAIASATPETPKYPEPQPAPKPADVFSPPAAQTQAQATGTLPRADAAGAGGPAPTTASSPAMASYTATASPRDLAPADQGDAAPPADDAAATPIPPAPSVAVAPPAPLPAPPAVRVPSSRPQTADIRRQPSPPPTAERKPPEPPAKPRPAQADARTGPPQGRFLDDASRPFPSASSPSGATTGSRQAGQDTMASLTPDSTSRPPSSGSPSATGEPPAPVERPISTSKIGLLCQAVTADQAPDYGLDNPRGLLVTGVVVGSGAYNAGIRYHDVILTVKGTPIADLSGLARIAAGTPAGQSVPVEIMRNKQAQVVQLKVDQIRQ
jgi:serine/threonine protein kinase